MNAHPWVSLGEVCAINPPVRRSERPDADIPVSFVPMAAVSEREGAITTHEPRPLSQVSKGFTAFAEGDVLFAKITPCMENGKVAIAQGLTNGIGRGSTEFFVLRPNGKVLPEFIYHFVRRKEFRDEARRNFTGTAGQQRVPKSFMERVQIPLPPLEEQRRIVDILNRAVSLQRLQDQVSVRLRALIPALFIRMFGDPLHNPMGWEIRPLGELVDFKSGGTPAKKEKSYWGGDVPWVSPKDMKKDVISASMDTLTELALDKTSVRLVPTSSILIVVRGMILSHTVPIGVNTRPVTINQDIKAMIIKNDTEPKYLMQHLKSQHSYLVNRVSTAAHGTKRLEMSILQTLPIMVPPPQLQSYFSELVTRARAIIATTDTAAQTTAALSASLMARLFEEPT